MSETNIERNGLMVFHFYEASKNAGTKYRVLCIDKGEDKSKRLFSYIIFRRDKIIPRDTAQRAFDDLNSIPHNIEKGEKVASELLSSWFPEKNGYKILFGFDNLRNIL
ncbi:hypothetical protein J4403_04120 [Candidatus Woesearchaeota archaeon]|nr:hypothetical protein [Candidatus Woesearchaeota archaeon]